MSAVEILLLIVGAIILVAGYVLPNKDNEKDTKNSTAEREKKIKELVEQSVEAAKGKIEDIVEETVSYSMEKTERSMERISNEKIMAIQEYSDTVLAEINKNHEEEVFLYDMLNSKHDSLVETVKTAGKTVADVKQTLQDAQITVQEAQTTAQEARITAQAAQEVKTIQVTQPAQEMKTIQAAQQAQDDPNAQLAEIIKKSVKAGKKKKALETRDETKDIKQLLEEMETDVPEKTDEITEEYSGYTPEEEAEFMEYGANRMSPDIQLNKGPALGGNNNEHILEMHRTGKSNMAIAKELGLGIGEVKLVIDLYKGMGK